jgi:hypothetical protein
MVVVVVIGRALDFAIVGAFAQRHDEVSEHPGRLDDFDYDNDYDNDGHDGGDVPVSTPLAYSLTNPNGDDR